jgi:hypothetical protein
MSADKIQISNPKRKIRNPNGFNFKFKISNFKLLSPNPEIRKELQR